MSATTHEIPSSPTPHPNPDFDNLWKAWQPTPKSKSDDNVSDSMDMNDLDLNGYVKYLLLRITNLANQIQQHLRDLEPKSQTRNVQANHQFLPPRNQ